MRNTNQNQLRPVADLELSLDTASALASIALSRAGRLVAELTWACNREHSTQLLPAIDALLVRQGVSKDDLRAVFVCIGPGGYSGVRVGVSTAKGLSFGLALPLVGVGRLEIEAYAFAAAGLTVAVHKAGRGEFAWASYEGTRNEDPGTRPPPSEGTGNQEQGPRPPHSPTFWRELSAPRLTKADALAGELPSGALVTGDIDDALAEQLRERGWRVATGAAALRRASLLAELGWRRLQAGQTDDPNSLQPLYLREPAIGPQ
jgi:tRNA threonylcarbamoyladenosine biosynthesis protein TsaB